MKYDHTQIAKELEVTANGDSYYGNALYVALDLPWTTQKHKEMLQRYLHGSELLSDRFTLQDFAILTRFEGKL
jgi:hypothetical protein